jgi:hypothetical protein
MRPQQRLEDRESIRNLIMEYGRALDERDWRGFAGGEWIGGRAWRRDARPFRN